MGLMVLGLIIPGTLKLSLHFPWNLLNYDDVPRKIGWTPSWSTDGAC